ncbi:NCS2 family permease [Inconstantimicrobium mannanitabidum]|uniref:Xanthine/uracil permease n=1 Tax=Inconstantimicrobium mannanitabidum TaxID=1604901 RepID=A0ACB5RGQ2_9CLOT|nr:NCS2 family permease [Clostridium sp. TW13]GKX68279.1 xanthine/uracil permease [Clostridium sp. TW13]
MNKIFNLSQNNTSFKKELVAGLTAFFSIVYIIAVNASILKDAGIPLEAGIIATVLSSIIGCFLVAFISNAPLIVVPGMGINALFTYTVVGSLGLNYKEALGAVFISGILFIIIAFSKLSEIISNAIPASIKEAVTVGIGLFIAFIGLQKSALIVSNAHNFVTLGNLTDPVVYVTIINLVIALFLYLKKVPGNFLISIIIGTLISMAFGIVDFNNLQFTSISFSSYKDVFLSFSFAKFSTLPFWTAVFSLVLVLVFENIGILHSQVNGMLNSPEKNAPSLKAISISTILCGLLGTSPTVSTVETAAGITAGGRTGLTSVITGLLFLLSLFFIPFIKFIPNSAISPILIIIGCFMISNVVNIDFNDFTEGFPAFLIIIMIPLTYSIVDGLAFGFISYPIVKLFAKDSRKIPIPMFIISFLFLINFILPHM